MGKGLRRLVALDMDDRIWDATFSRMLPVATTLNFLGYAHVVPSRLMRRGRSLQHDLHARIRLEVAALLAETARLDPEALDAPLQPSDPE